MREHVDLARSESGFTLIELLVVVAIIGILSAIAIPQFSAYRERGFDGQAVADLKNLALAQDSYFAVNGAYTTQVADLEGFVGSPGVTVTVESITTTAYTASSVHQHGSTTHRWDSASGGLQGAS